MKQVDSLALDKTAKLGLRCLFFSSGAGFLWLALWWPKLPPEVPLLYSLAYGEGRLVNHWTLWLFALSMFLIDLVSVRIARDLIEADRLLAQILVWSAAGATVIGLITLVQVVLLVT